MAKTNYFYGIPPSNKKNKKTKAVINLTSDSDSDSDNDDDNDTKSQSKIKKSYNHIYFYSEVDRGSVYTLTELIRSAEKENLFISTNYNIEPPPIYLHISSFGGSVFDAFTCIDIIMSCKVDIYTIIDGATASAGTLISVVGKKRYIRPSGYMLIHQLSSGFWGKMQEIEDDFQNNKKLMKKIRNIYKKHTNIPKDKLNDILKHDLWWESDICKEYSLIDEIWNQS